LGINRPCEPAPAVSNPKGTVILESDVMAMLYISYMQLFMIDLIKKNGVIRPHFRYYNTIKLGLQQDYRLQFRLCS